MSKLNKIWRYLIPSLFLTGMVVFNYVQPVSAAYLTGGSGFWSNNGTSIYYNNGNIGIGTDLPTRQLHLLKNTSATSSDGVSSLKLHNAYNAGTTDEYGVGLEFQLSSDYQDYKKAEIRAVNNGGFGNSIDLAFWSGGSSAAAHQERMRIKSNGSVGIGITNPSAKLHVAGSLYTNSSVTFAGPNFISGGNRLLMVDNGGNLSATTSAIMPSGTNGQTIRNNSGSWVANSLLYNNGTNIGIGTTNPADKLAVYGTIAKETTTGYDGTFDNLIKYGTKSDLESGTTNANRWLGIDGTITAGAAAANKMKFRVYGGGTGNAVPVDVMTLQGNGNVGIGRTDPGYKLDITGTMRATAGGAYAGIFNATADSQIVLQSSDSWAGIGFDDSGSTNDFFWYNGDKSTFAIGGGGSNVSGKKLHVDGAVTIGSTYDNSSTTANGLLVEGQIKMPNQTIGASEDVINKGYLDSALTVFNTNTNFWKLSGNNLYPSSTDWNVGIGTTTPGAQLTINKTSNPTLRFNIPLGEEGAKSGIIEFFQSNYSPTYPRATIRAERTAAGSNGRLVFATSYNTNLAPEDRMTITESGYVGIGTTNPSSTLSVANALKLTSGGTIYSQDNSSYLDLSSSLAESVKVPKNIYTTGGDVTIGGGDLYGGVSGGVAGVWRFSSTYPNYGILYSDLTNDRLDFSPNGGGTSTPVMSIVGNGNVGIGVGSATPGALLQVGNDLASPTILIESNDAGTAGLEFGEHTGARGSLWYTGNGYMHLGMNNRTREHMRFAYDATSTWMYGNVYFPGSAYFSGQIYVPLAPSSSTSAVSKNYVDTTFAPITGAASLWATSSTGVYNVGLGNVAIGATTHGAKLNVAGTGIFSSTIYNADSGRWLDMTGALGDSLKVSSNLNSTAGVLTTSGSGNNYMLGTLSVGTTTIGAYRLYVNGSTYSKSISVSTPAGSWITGKNGTAGYNAADQQTVSSYHPMLRQKTSSGHVINLGGLGDDFGFYGYLASRTVNGTDYSFTMNLNNGNMTASNDIVINGGDLSINNNNGGINFNDASAYWLKAATNWGLYWNTADNRLQYNGAGTTVSWLDLDDGSAVFNGNVGIGAASSGEKLEISGNIKASGAIAAQSGTYLTGLPWFNCNAGCGTGYVKLVTPIVHNEGNMFNIHIVGYGYGDSKGIDSNCYGYAYYAGSLVNYNCQNNGSAAYPIEIGVENRGGTNFVVVRIGTPASTWYFQHFTAEYRGWIAKSASGFSWVSGETTPAQTGNTNNVIINDQAGTGYFLNQVTVGAPSAASHAATKSYVDSVITGAIGTTTSAYVLRTGDTMTGDLNMGNKKILGVSKITVGTIDPLYDIKGIKYSTFASAIVGGVKEEYVGQGQIKNCNSQSCFWYLDFDQTKEGSDPWVWRQTIDFRPEKVEVLMTAQGLPTQMSYEFKDNGIIFHSEKPTKFSYRLIGARFDWREWPTKALDQTEKASLTIK